MKIYCDECQTYPGPTRKGDKRMKYDKLLNAGNKAQLERLEEKEKQGYTGWDDISLYYAIDKINSNLSKMRNATHKETRKAAANIANFAHMIIYQCDSEIRKVEKDGKEG